MKFNFDCEQCLDCDQNGFSVLEGSCQNRIIPGYRLYVKEILDIMGQLSSKAQNLQTIITNTSRFFPSNHRLFIKAEGNMVFGYLKIGLKKLFLRDRLFNYHERKTLCVLDFYVYDAVQRKGIGKQLFDYMLNYEKINPYSLAYDRPTLRLLSFLKKNYGLDNYITQSNSFIIFDNFFSENSILNYDTEFDNDTHRVIQTLRTPEDLNTNNYPINNFKRYMPNSNLTNNHYPSKDSPKLKSNEYENYEEETYSKNKKNILQRSMSPIGKKLIYNNNFTNNIINKEIYKSPNSGFKNYYLNKEDTLAYDNIYSKKKINLINDYMSSKKLAPQEFVHEQNHINENSINNSNKRQNELNNKIYDIKYNKRYKDDELYNKRYHYSTLFDDKKLAENEYTQQNRNLYRSQDFINQKEYQNFHMNKISSPKHENANYNQIQKTPLNYKNNYNNQNYDIYKERRNGKTEYSDNFNLNNFYDDRRIYY